VKFLTSRVDSDGLVLLNGNLLDLTRFDSSHQGGQVDIGGIFACGIYQLIKQQGPGNNQQPKNNLSSCRT
jgi:hypothetical protein